MRRLALSLLMLAALPSAHAQANTFETSALGLATPCLNGATDAANAPATVTLCLKTVTDVEALRETTPNLAGHDLNVYHVVMAMAQTRIGSSYGRIDGVRSARVCERSEAGWEHTSKFKSLHSPAYADMAAQLVSSSVGAIEKCRSEFGTPAGATPLPPV